MDQGRVSLLIEKNSRLKSPSPRNRVCGKPQNYAAPADYLTIREEDAPGITKLKKLAALDSSQLENLPEDLIAEMKMTAGYTSLFTKNL